MKVRCPLCGLFVDNRRFDRVHSLDFKLYEFFGSPKGKKGGGIRAYAFDISKMEGGSSIYNDIIASIKRAVKRLNHIFGVEIEIDRPIPIIVPMVGNASAEVRWT